MALVFNLIAFLVSITFCVSSLSLLNFRGVSPMIKYLFRQNVPRELTRRSIAFLNLIIFGSGIFISLVLLKSTENINRIFDAPALFQLGAISLLVVTFLKENKHVGNDRLLTFGSFGILWFFLSGLVTMGLTLFSIGQTVFSQVMIALIEHTNIAVIYLGGLNLCSAGLELIEPEEKHGRTAKK